MSDFWRLGEPVWQLVLRSASIYLLFLVALRAFGKREIGQFTPFDLVLLLLVANALQPAITGQDSSFAGGMVIVLTLFLLNRLVDYIDFKFPRIGHAIVGKPKLVAEDGRWLDDVLRKEGIDEEERDLILRKQGYEDVKQVRKAILETDGSVSIFPLRDEDGGAPP